MRLPNGYGSISKLSGPRRNPYIVRKTIGYNAKGQAIHTILGYAKTRSEGLQILAAANNHVAPKSGLTLAKIYRIWLPIHANNVGKSAIDSYRNAYKHIHTIANIPLQEVKYRHLQSVIDTMRANGLSYASCKKVRSLLNQLFKYAIVNEYVERDYGPYLKLGKNAPVKPHKPFTKQQINKLWKIESDAVFGVLILLYTGMRCGELLNLRKRDINRKSKYLVISKSKTLAGTNRIIPIHKRIEPILDTLYHSADDYLFPTTYTTFSKQFKKVMQTIKCKHTTHDCRHTVATLLDSSGANPNAVRAILGHKNGDITTRVYTHKTIADLRRAINKLK